MQICDSFELENLARGGPLWGGECDDLNITLLSWQSGQGVAAHRNTELDVVWIGIEGEAEVQIDDAVYALRPGVALVIAKGSERALKTHGGVRYFSVHRRRVLMPTVKIAP